jgi:hypothetical protein
MTYMMALLLGSVVAACSSDLTELEQPTHPAAGAIVLNIAGGNLGVDTRAEDIADSDKESAVKHLDIMIFNDAELDEEKTLFYAERATVATDDGKVALGVDIDDIEIGAKYWVYVVANSTHPASLFAQITDVEALFDLTQQDYNVHLTASGLQNTPSHFLMDGVAYMGAAEPATAGAITIAEAPITDVVELSVKLRRAAAKVVVRMMASDKIEFANNIEGSTPGYYVRNLPNHTRIINDGILRKNEALETTHESISPYFKWVTDEGGNITAVELTFYVYSHMWETGDSFNYATNLLIDIPAYYSPEVDGVRKLVVHPNNYYQVPLSKEFLFERNHYYEVTAYVHAPGAEDFSEPVEVKDLKYEAYPWTEHTIDVGGQAGPEYLKVNLDELKMYNTAIDAESLLFSSSSPVTISVIDCYYIDKFGIKQTISPANYHISGTTPSGSISGNITVNSDLPQNNTIRYFTLVITNQTGQTETVLVEQYPLVYIVNVQGHYSYRDDFKKDGNAPTTIYNQGSAISSVALSSWNNQTKRWSYSYSANSSGFWRSKVVVETYSENHNQSSHRGRSDVDYYYYSSNFGSSYLQYRTSNAEDPSNARMYHVRITASSGEYNLGVPRLTTSSNVDFAYTDPGDDNARLVSPSFMIASRLGFVNSGSPLSAASNQERRQALSRDHCAYYVEVAENGTVYDDWRLPTASELKIIMDLQGTKNESADAIDYLLNADYYYSASGPVFNDGNDSYVDESRADEDSWAIRCIRDAY